MLILFFFNASCIVIFNHLPQLNIITVNRYKVNSNSVDILLLRPVDEIRCLGGAHDLQAGALDDPVALEGADDGVEDPLFVRAPLPKIRAHDQNTHGQTSEKRYLTSYPLWAACSVSAFVGAAWSASVFFSRSLARMEARSVFFCRFSTISSTLFAVMALG